MELMVSEMLKEPGCQKAYQIACFGLTHTRPLLHQDGAHRNKSAQYYPENKQQNHFGKGRLAREIGDGSHGVSQSFNQSRDSFEQKIEWKAKHASEAVTRIQCHVPVPDQ